MSFIVNHNLPQKSYLQDDVFVQSLTQLNQYLEF
jgi:hypothetical protein